MGIAAAVFVALLGVLAPYPALEPRLPRLRDMIGPLVAYQSGIGVVAVLLGAMSVALKLLDMGQLRWAPLFWLLDLVAGLLVLALGLLLGHDLLAASLFKNSAAAQDKAAALRNRLSPHQVRLGYTGILMGAVITLLHIVY